MEVEEAIYIFDRLMDRIADAVKHVNSHSLIRGICSCGERSAFAITSKKEVDRY